MMKRIFSAKIGFLLLLVALPALVQSQSVDQDELMAGRAPIEFTNYEGPYARIDSRGAIRGIGAGLGTNVSSSSDAGGGSSQFGGTDGYFVIHSVSAPEGNKLDADIFGLGPNAGVDHIRNLRLIVQGYLETAYGYSARDAALLAEFVTIYNAVFRGNWDYLSGRYKTAVMGNLERGKAGLSQRFDEWPGRTLMVIPLTTTGAGTLSAVDTSSLTAPEVIEDMRSQEDRGVESRREMVEFKEREAGEAEARADEQRQAVEREQGRVEAQRQDAAAEREQIAREREQAQADAEAGRTTPAEQARQEEQLAAREEAADEREAQIDREAETTADMRRDAEESEAFSEQKQEEARTERQEIARDQQAIIAQEDAREPAAPQGIIGVRLDGAESSLGKVVRLNTNTGAELRAGGMNAVNARTVTQAGGKLIAIAGENRGNAAIRLVEINPESLEMTAQGDVDIHPQSLLWQSGDNLYAISIGRDGQPHLSRFNTSLAQVAQSAITVHPLGAPSFQGDVLLIQRADGSVALLNIGDLGERR
jgi:hypothetical protein